MSINRRRRAKIVSHGRYVAFQMAEVAIPQQMFQEILQLIAELRPPPDVAPAKGFNRHAFKPNPREGCDLMTNKVSAFGASPLRRMKSALSTHKGGGFALSRGPN
jgi:hypothetical protein